MRDDPPLLMPTFSPRGLGRLFLSSRLFPTRGRAVNNPTSSYRKLASKRATHFSYTYSTS